MTRIGGRFVQPDGSVVEVVDAPVDRFNIRFLSFSDPLGGDDCRLLTPVLGVTISSGNIMVTDAQPFPTAKEQCKNGGWRQYGVFKNQGDCVSFVATGGKNPPAGP